MSFSDWLGDDSSFPTGRIGTQYERAFRILTYLLSCWCYHPDKRKKDDNRTHNRAEKKGLSVIAFDKLAVFSYRVWNAVYTINNGGARPIQNADNITFPFPFHVITGKHGRGLALPKWSEDGYPGFLPTILYKLQQDGITKNYVKFDGEPNNYETIVYPGIADPPDSKIFFQNMTSYEKDVLNDLQNALKRLNNHEIRVLGTHHEKEATIDDIDKLFKKWGIFRDKVTSKLGALSKVEEPVVLGAAREMVWHAEEAWRKSTDNRDTYKEAYSIVHRELIHPELKKAFTLSHCAEQDIWNCRELNILGEHSAKALAVSKYILGIVHFSYHAEYRKSVRKNEYHRNFEEGLQFLRRDTKINLPDVEKSFLSESSRELRADVLTEIKKFCEIL